MTKQVVNIGDTGGAMVLKLANNFNELYADATYKTVADMVAATGHAVGDTARVINYSAACKSGPLTFIAVTSGTATPDGGSYINGSGVQWEQQFGSKIDAKSWGVGTPDTSDHTRWQSAIDYVKNTLGGGEINFSGSSDIYENVTMKNGVVIKGVMTYPSGYKANPSTGNAWGSKVFCHGDVGFLLSSGAVIDGLYIQKSDVTFPQTSLQSQSWTGTAISGDVSGSAVKNCMILGFERAIDIGDPLVSGTSARNLVDRVFIDCKNGVRISGSNDTDRIIDVTCWPFLSSVITEADRAGTGIEGVNSDGRHIEGCFVFAYNKNYHCNDCNQWLMTNCGSDADITTTDATRKGLLVSGASSNVRVSTTRFTGKYETGIEIDMSDDNNGSNIAISDCFFGSGAATNQILITDGWYVSVSDSYLITGTRGIRVSADMGLKLSVDGCSFIGNGYPISNAATLYNTNQLRWDSSNQIIAQQNNHTWENANINTATVASATNMAVPQNSDYILVTGTTTINALFNGVPNRIVVFSFTNGTTVNNGASIKTKSGSPVVYAAGDRAMYICAGGAWYEVCKL